MTDFGWADTLPTLLDKVWERLGRGIADRRAPARHITLATIGLDGAPQQRTVVLRGADRGAGWLELHTDTQSTKMAELARDARASIHIWDDRVQMQMRLGGVVAPVSAEETAKKWPVVPAASRMAYGVTPPPGQPIPGPDAFARAADRSRFQPLRLMLQRMDIVVLAVPTHRRAVFQLADDWAGDWRAP